MYQRRDRKIAFIDVMIEILQFILESLCRGTACHYHSIKVLL